MSQQKQTVSLNPSETKSVPFTFTPTAPGVYNVSVDGLSGSFEAVALPAEVYGVTGVVISADTGLPLLGAIVSAFGMPEWTQTTDANGRFTITGLTVASVYIDVSYPNYVKLKVSFVNLINGVVKDIGQIKLSLVSAIQFISVAMPTKTTVYLNERYYYAGFRVKNVSSLPAYAQLGFNQNAGSWNIQLLLQPGQTSDWYGTPYPVAWSSHHTGNFHLYASLNGVVVGECDVTVLPLPSAEISFTPNCYYRPAYEHQTVKVALCIFEIELENTGQEDITVTIRVDYEKPDGTVVHHINWEGYKLAVRQKAYQADYFEVPVLQVGTYVLDAYLDWGGIKGQRHAQTTVFATGIIEQYG